MLISTYGLLGFVGFVVNLLNRSIDSVTIQGQKSTSEKELILVRKITFLIKAP
jgi:hypothetical protein